MKLKSLALSLLLLIPPITSAVDERDVYTFEIIVFERPDGGHAEFWPAEPDEPERSGARARLDTLPAATRTLDAAAYTLKKKGLVVHQHLAWRQAPAARNSDTWYWVGSSRLQGLLRLSRGRYLHLDTDLLLRDAASSQTYRIRLHRRMRSGELHYVDHPKLGILVQAERYEAPEPVETPTDPASGEPKPAAPLGTSTGKPG